MVLFSRDEQMKPPKAKIKKVLVILSSGILFLIISALLIASDPILLYIKYWSRLENGTYVFEIFKSEVEGVRIIMHIFNITNADQFISGEDYKLKVEEIGPFTYVETRQNIDVDLDLEAGLLRFTPRASLRFLPDESVGRPEDVMVTVPNLALVSACSMLKSYPYWIRQAFNILVHQYRYKSITTMTAQNFLWGFDDPLISLANTVAPGLIYFEKLGLLDRIFDHRIFYRMELGVSNTDKFSIKTLKKYLRNKTSLDSAPLESYVFNDTYEGIAYRLDIKPDTPLNIYRIGVCKTFELEYVDKMTMDYGPEGYIYKINNRTFTRDCQDGKVPCGLMDLSCLFGLPLGLSKTHFLHMEPQLYERIEGLNPDENIHDSQFILEPQMGVELVTKLSIQTNLVLGDLSFNKEANAFSNMIVPIAYLNVVQPKLIDDLIVVFKVIHIYVPKILTCIEIILLIAGIGSVAYGIRLILYTRMYTKEDPLRVKTNKKHKMPLIKHKS